MFPTAGFCFLHLSIIRTYTTVLKRGKHICRVRVISLKSNLNHWVACIIFESINSLYFPLFALLSRVALETCTLTELYRLCVLVSG